MRRVEGFGGGDEDGLLCGCGKRVRTPCCPWCGKRIDDAGVQLLSYLEARADENERNAATREKGGRFGNAKHDAHDKRTAVRLRQTAEQRRAWAAWVKARLK